jgi:5-bromo-4-chloroindolyl phosphate hydrolysis protein
VNLTTLRRNPKRFIKQNTPHLYRNGLLLYVLPLLAIPATIKALVHGNLPGILINAGSYAAYLLAARLLRHGLIAEKSYHERRVANPPKWRLKAMAAGVLSMTTLLLAWIGGGYSLKVALAFGLGAFLGMELCYGFDPRKVKTISGDHGFSVEEINRIVSQAESVIAKIENANDKIRDANCNRRLDAICTTARQIVEDLEANPAGIRRARKFLLVYLDGAEKVANGFAAVHQQTDDVETGQNFRELLDDLERVFKEQQQKLLEEDLFDLDVQMEVLAKQLKHEGIH